MSGRRPVALAIVVVLLVAGVAGAAGLVMRGESRLPEELRGVALAEPVLLGRMEFAGESGPVIFPTGVSGRWTLLSIGYTHCPDVCPFLLGNLADVENRMKEVLHETDLPRVLFVSVDPDRDSPGFLAEYTSYFSDRFIGLTGEKAEIDKLVATLGAFYRLGRKDENGTYAVDHSAEVYLIDPQGRLYARLHPPLDPGPTIRLFEQIRGFYRRAAV